MRPPWPGPCRVLHIEERSARVQELRLGIDVASVESHRAALADETGRLI
jgi:hypothetical protein